MACTETGKNEVLKALLNNAKLALGLATKDSTGKIIEFTEISSNSDINPGYNRVDVIVGNPPSNNDKTKMYVSIIGGTATNLADVAFKDADDGETADSLTEITSGGWQSQVDSIGIYRGSTLYYAALFTDMPMTVYQGHRIRIAAGNFSLTFSPTEVASTSEQAISTMDLNSAVQVEE